MHELLDRIEVARPRVLVLGDAIQDIYRHVEFVRWTDEGGERRPIYRVCRQHETKWGGAAAVADMAEALGAEAVRGHGLPRSIKERYLCDGKMIGPRIDHEGQSVPNERPDMTGCDALLVADYGKGGCENVRQWIASANELGLPIIVDPARGVTWERYDGAKAIKCNHAEWDAARGRGTNDRSEYTVRTDGPRGIDVCRKGTHSWANYPAEPCEVVDVTGAGDMVLAVLGVCLASGIELPDACRLANAAAGLKCRKLGAVPVSLQEIREHLCAAVL